MPVTIPLNSNGHALGCPCAGCEQVRADSLRKMRVRYANGEEPETLGEVLAAEIGKRRRLFQP